MKKICSVLLIIAMTVCFLSSCNDGGETSDVSVASANSAPAESQGTETESSAGASEECWLPEKKWDTNLIWASEYAEGDKSDVRYYEIWCDEDLGDTVSKSVLARSRWLENTYGITIEMLWTNSEDGAVAYAKKAQESNLPLDVITAPIYDIAPTITEGYFYDFREINSTFNDGKGWIKLDEPYWDQNSMHDYSISNKVFMLTGDICLYDDENTWAMFFNKDMITEYGFENPYVTVKEGNWTLDVLYEYCKKVTEPDGEKLTWDATANHKWGMVTQVYDCPMFMLGCGQRLVQKDANDLPVLRVDEQRNVDIAHKVLEMLIDENKVGMADFYGAWNTGVYGEEMAIFANGHAMFLPTSMVFLSTQHAKNSDVDIGVIPMPKADSVQEDYSSSSNVYWLHMVSIPKTNVKNLEATLFALEAMAWYGQRYINPEYYEKVLKLQKFQDEDAEEMLDLIFKNRTYDMGIAYDWANMMAFYDTLVCSKSTDIVTLYDSKKESFQAAIDETIDAFTKE